MARPLRFEYPGAVYHLMARGDGGKLVFTDRDDHLLFLHRLGEVCKSRGWVIHAWVLMGNHFHLLAETPEPNLVSGMRLLLGGFSQAWNRRRNRKGHVFQGRYKSIPVAGGQAADAAHFKTVADYIHLNPARSGIAGGTNGPLADYEWSSLPCYRKGRGPAWLSCDRVLRAHDLSTDPRGCRAYGDYLEARAAENKGRVSESAMAALRRGWYLGDETFKDRLLNLLDKPKSGLREKGSLSGRVLGDHGEHQAERLIAEGLAALGMAETDPPTQRKGDPGKVALATLVRSRTSVGNLWVAQRLHMGHDRSVSRLIRQGSADPEVVALVRRLEKMLPCED